MKSSMFTLKVENVSANEIALFYFHHEKNLGSEAFVIFLIVGGTTK